MTTTDTLADWIDDKLAERERVARAAEADAMSPWAAWRNVVHDGGQDPEEADDESGTLAISVRVAKFIASHDPASVLLDVASKRRILELHTPVHDMACAVCGWGEGSGDLYGTFWPCSTVQALAAGMGWTG